MFRFKIIFLGGKAATALDLGGGSTQVTFIPSDFNTAMRGLHRQKYSHRLKIFEKELRLYTHRLFLNFFWKTKFILVIWAMDLSLLV